MIPHSDLAALLAALQSSGVAVGPLERERLYRALCLAPDLEHSGEAVDLPERKRLHRALCVPPDLEREELRVLLACVLVKDPEQQRPNFDWLFDRFVPEVLPEPEPEPGPKPSSESEREADSSGPEESARHPSQPQEKKEGSQTRQSGRSKLPRASWGRLGKLPQVWFGSLGVVGSLALAISSFLSLPSDASSRWVAILVFSAAALVGLLVVLYRNRKHAPPKWPAAASQDHAAPAVRRIDPAGESVALLDARERRFVVWGVEHFLSEDPARQLDVDATVAATARQGGLPVLVPRREKYPREVWLWVEMERRNPTMTGLARNLYRALNQAGLPVRLGWFRRYPDPVIWDTGQAFSPLVLEGHRRQALVVVFTDGQELSAVMERGADRNRLLALLRGLGQWPKLVFVDFGRGRLGLAARLRNFRITCVAPEDLPAFMGMTAGRPLPPQPPDPRLCGEMKLWRGGAALWPYGIRSPALALDLIRAMDLGSVRWRLDDVLAAGGGTPDRVACLSHLAQAGGVEHQGVSYRDRALDFWEGYIRQSYDPSPQSRHRRLDLELALLVLWREPSRAAVELDRLAREDEAMKVEIQDRLAQYTAADWSGGGKAVPLPWRWSSLPGQTWRLLWQLDFGKDTLCGKAWLRPAGGYGMALGVGVGVAAGAAVGLGGMLGAAGLVVGMAVGVYFYGRLQAEAKDVGRRRADDRGHVTPSPSPKPPTPPPPPPPLDEPLTMIELEGGTFWMGSPAEDDMAMDQERPQHQVTLSPFALGQMPVTRGLWREVMGEGLEDWKDDGSDALPANYVTWFQAVAFCNALSQRVGLQPCYRIEGEEVSWEREADGYRLPTEAEWEYAARGGTETRYFFGNDPKDLGEYAWYGEGLESDVHPVGQKKANPFGLYDMLGNVWEWCWDGWSDKYDDKSVTDPTGPDKAGAGGRVVRGGSCWVGAEFLRCAVRAWDRPEDRVGLRGFRVARASRRQP